MIRARRREINYIYIYIYIYIILWDVRVVLVIYYYKSHFFLHQVKSFCHSVILHAVSAARAPPSQIPSNLLDGLFCMSSVEWFAIYQLGESG